MAKDSDRLVVFGFAKKFDIEVDGKKYVIEGKTFQDRRKSLDKIKKELVGKEKELNAALESIADH